MQYNEYGEHTLNGFYRDHPFHFLNVMLVIDFPWNVLKKPVVKMTPYPGVITRVRVFLEAVPEIKALPASKSDILSQKEFSG
jgi:hypothetical protein